VRRVGHLFESIVAFENLLGAFKRARRGKRGRASVERFARRLEPELQIHDRTDDHADLGSRA
jgi:hypothetical protein